MKKLALLSCLLMLFAGCAEITPDTNEDPIPDKGIELGTGMSPSVVLHPKGSFVNVRFNSANDWHIELPADTDWLEVSPLEGAAGTGRIKIKAAANLTGENRAAEVHVCSADDVLKLTVSQENFVPMFELVTSEANMSFLGGPLSIKLLADMEFDYECDADWVVPAETKADDDYTVLLFNVTQNNGTEERSTVITFDNGATTLNFALTQGTDGLEGTDWKSAAFVHRSLAMRFTATWCGYCPGMASAFDSAQEQMPGALEVVSLHVGDSDLAFSGTRSLQSRFEVSSLPTGVVDNRGLIPSYSSSSYIVQATIGVAMETQREYPATVGLAYGSQVSGSELNVSLGLYAKEAGTYKVVVLLLEDGIVAYQNGGGNKYQHDHVARLALTSMSGESVKVDSGGELVVKNFTGKLRSEWNPDNLKVLVYVEKPYGSARVQEVNLADYGDFGDTYIDNCRVIKVGQAGTLELK